MPFFAVEQQIPTRRSKTDQVPLFLIPSILGVGAEYQHIIQQLRDQGETRPIYVYYDENILGSDDLERSTKQSSLQEQAQKIASDIQTHLPAGPLPYMIVGYSYGCSLAALAAQKLTDQNQQCHVYLIDGPSPETSRAYFSKLSTAVIYDLIDIVKYAAKSALSSNEAADQLNFINLESHVSTLKGLPLTQCLDSIKRLITQRIPSLSSNEFFDKYYNVAKQNVINLATYTPDEPTTKLSQAVTLITYNTAKKYQTTYGGWENYTEKLSFVTDVYLRDKDHMELLKAKEDYRLASNIKRFIDITTNPEALLTNHFKHLYRTFVQLDDSTNELGYNSSPESSPELSHSSGYNTPTSIESFSDDSEDDSEELDSRQTRKKVNETKFLLLAQQTLFSQRGTSPSKSPRHHSAESLDHPEDTHLTAGHDEKKRIISVRA